MPKSLRGGKFREAEQLQERRVPGAGCSWFGQTDKQWLRQWTHLRVGGGASDSHARSRQGRRLSLLGGSLWVHLTLKGWRKLCSIS